jgi:hypothetical protein
LFFQGTFVASTIKNVEKTTTDLLEEKQHRKQFIKNIFDVNLSYELFNCGQTRSYSDGETKSVNIKVKKNLENDNSEEDEDMDMFLSDTCLDKGYLKYNFRMECGMENDEMNVAIRDFEFLKLISKGAYGRVWLVKRVKTQDIYAMKIVNFAEKVRGNYKFSYYFEDGH